VSNKIVVVSCQYITPKSKNLFIYLFILLFGVMYSPEDDHDTRRNVSCKIPPKSKSYNFSIVILLFGVMYSPEDENDTRRNMSCKILPLKKSKSYNFSIVILFWSNVLS
jgi:hypothetical protein